MVEDFTIRPADGWAEGDRAYCVRGSKRTRPTLEAGKVYIVAKVTPIRGHVNDSLMLKHVALPEGFGGVMSGRFVKVPAGAGALQAIECSTSRGWYEAYRMSQTQLPAPPETAREED